MVGDKTDGALLLYAHQHIHDPQAFKKQGKIIEEYPFDSETKMITTVLEKNDVRHIFVRGAPEMVLEKSTASEEHKKIIMHEIETFAKEGLRVIGFASKHAPDGETLTRSHMESDLTFLGLIGIYDPPRPEAAQAVQEAKKCRYQNCYGYRRQ